MLAKSERLHKATFFGNCGPDLRSSTCNGLCWQPPLSHPHSLRPQPGRPDRTAAGKRSLQGELGWWSQQSGCCKPQISRSKNPGLLEPLGFDIPRCLLTRDDPELLRAVHPLYVVTDFPPPGLTGTWSNQGQEGEAYRKLER